MLLGLQLHQCFRDPVSFIIDGMEKHFDHWESIIITCVCEESNQNIALDSVQDLIKSDILVLVVVAKSLM